ncbi:MAG: TraB/GumN family protein [Spirochaetaceae bacterium]|nr:TraB/GumN family protein [Spirochaetaceae bacterium]
MTDTIATFQGGGKTITLLGTAHVSQGSIDEVRNFIEKEKPGMVCVELDQGRYASMVDDAWDKLDMVKVFREGKGFLLMANLVLAGFQRRLGNELGVKPGAEMKTAVETAKALGIPYALCDREVQITLRRAWSRCGFWDKSKLLASLLSSAFTREKLNEEEIENLKKHNELGRMMKDLADYLPPVKKTLIDERDRYLAAKIWSAGANNAGGKILAVVGAGHMAGIMAHLEKIAAGEADTGVEALDQIPSRSILSRIVPWILPALILLLTGYSIYKLGARSSLPVLCRWIFWNGGLAALGACLAAGHPLSVLVSLVGAPIGTVNPFVGVGLFSGLVEIGCRKPRVEDAQSINDDISSLRGVYRNRITRALLVFLLSSIGGMIGNAISIPSIAGELFK